MKRYTIVQINGDGIGGEVIPAARQVLEALGLPLDFVEADAGFGTFQKTGTALPQQTIEVCDTADAILFGATQSPMDKVHGYQSPILELRRRYNLFANVRPAVDAHKKIDMVVVRENTEGLYVKQERLADGGATAIAERVITAGATRRIVDFACREAIQRPRRQLTIIHKANVLKETDGLFRRVAFETAEQFPEVTVDELLVDAAAMFMAQDSQRFDVIVTANLYGDVLSDLAAGLTGGLGLAPSANVGEGKLALFEPVHGSAPDIVGRDIADPRAAILSGALMLKHLGFGAASSHLKAAVIQTTHQSSTNDTTQRIINAVS